MAQSVVHAPCRRMNRLRHDGGFTIVETMIALLIFFIALMTLGFGTLTALRNIGFSRQRQDATGLANSALEELRGLPNSVIALGLNQSDLDNSLGNGTETKVTKTGSGTSAVYKFRGETIPFSSLGATEPENPHIKNFTVGVTKYTRYVYITNATGAATGGYHATVIVSWSVPQLHGIPPNVEAQTYIYASAPTSQDCDSSNTHPFSAPCQAFFFGVGSLDTASVTVTPTSTGSVGGMDFDSARIDLPILAMAAQIEQVTSLQGAAALAGGQVTVGGDTTLAGEEQVTSGADNDPGSPGVAYDSHSIGPQSAYDTDVSGNGNSITIVGTAGDVASVVSAIAASLANPCTTQTDGKPCGYGTVQENGTDELDLSIGSGVGTSKIAHFGTQATPSTSYVHRVISGSADGYVRTSVVRRMPTVNLGGLPAGLASAAIPSKWSGYLLQVTNYGASVQVDAGTSATAPTATVNAGTIQYWAGPVTGYQTITIPTAGGALPVTAVNVTDASSGITVTITPSLSMGPASTTEKFLSGSTTTAVDAQAVAGAPVTGTLAYTITKNGTQLASFLVNVNLGTTTAHGTYQPAPKPS
jgi:type II secretory pathway pseudopilin PulG